jgi:parallel beta-helix repeat protein
MIKWRTVGKSRQPCFRAVAVVIAGLLSMLISFFPNSALASSNLCVNPNGSQGCFVTIQAAIDSVSAPNTTVVVNPGTYTASCIAPACSVATISSAAANGSSLAGLVLQCAASKKRPVILDATSLDHAVYVSGVNHVTVEGCVAKRAEREGILVENADNVDIANNEVKKNDQAMAATLGKGNPPCPTFVSPGTPGTSAIQCCPDAFKGGAGNFPQDNDDCGEGIHLRSVTNSVVQGNSVHDNIGGILLTDESGPNDNNLVANNNSSNNLAFGGDCGVTLPSHLACTSSSTDVTGCTFAPPVNGVFFGNGVFHNAIVGNVLDDNGALGVGMFTNPSIPPGAATKAYGNLVSDNVVEDNGQPGIGIHVHAANGNADNNMIVENIVKGNGGDSEAEGNSPPKTGIEVLSNGNFPPFSPAAPIVGTIISQNKVSDEDIDVWVGNTATGANIFLNDLLGKSAIGVENAGTGSVTATDDFWNCPQGPGSAGCSSTSGTVVSSPFLSQRVSPGP